MAAPSDVLSDLDRDARRLLRDGSEEAWSTLTRLLTPWLHEVLRGLLPSPDDADDCVQRALVTLWRAHHTIRGESVLAWLRTTVRNEAKDVLKSPRYRHASTHGEEWDHIASTRDEDFELEHVMHSRLRAALVTLAPDMQQTFLLRVETGLSYTEIARVQDITVGAAKMRVLRTRMVLRKAYDDIAQ